MILQNYGNYLFNESITSQQNWIFKVLDDHSLTVDKNNNSAVFYYIQIALGVWFID